MRLSSVRVSSCLAVLILVAACSSDGATGTVSNERSVASLSISSPTDTLRSLQDTVRLSTSAADAQGNPIAVPALTWTSSDAAVASVSSTGLVTALLDGTTTITVSASDVRAQATITVAQTPAKLAFITQPSGGGLAGTEAA